MDHILSLIESMIETMQEARYQAARREISRKAAARRAVAYKQQTLGRGVDAYKWDCHNTDVRA